MRAQIVKLLPATTPDRQGWATDIYAAFAVLKIEPSTENICAVLAVTDQESNFSADPAVPGLARIARAEIERRAERINVPRFVVNAALRFESPNGKTYHDRLSSVRTEKQLSELYEDFISTVPMGKRLLQGSNPVHTGGPMQVSIAFAEQHAKARPYPYPVNSIRHEVFTRRGGMYFGIAHLLGYPAPYERHIYRFADFNAGFYASRNAAFQKAVSIASGIPITLDGDLVMHGRRGRDAAVGLTEVAVQSIAAELDMSDSQIRRALEKGSSAAFERSRLYERVFEIAEALEGKPLPRAAMPTITLESPKITRKLTTEWFATRVDQRYRRCLSRAAKL